MRLSCVPTVTGSSFCVRVGNSNPISRIGVFGICGDLDIGSTENDDGISTAGDPINVADCSMTLGLWLGFDALDRRVVGRTNERRTLGPSGTSSRIATLRSPRECKGESCLLRGAPDCDDRWVAERDGQGSLTVARSASADTNASLSPRPSR